MRKRIIRVLKSERRLHLEVHTETWAHRRGFGPAGAKRLGAAVSKNSVIILSTKANESLAGRKKNVVTWHYREAQLLASFVERRWRDKTLVKRSTYRKRETTVRRTI